jgi:signal transduction histidine kinase
MPPESLEPTVDPKRLAYLGTLANGLAHEIRNPLGTMKMNLQLLEEDWARAEQPREERSLKKVRVLMKEVQRLEEILDDFLRFARGYRLQPVETPVNRVLQELIEFVSPELEASGIRILSHLDPATGSVRLDAKHFKQALLNIIVNSQQAMNGGGDLLIRSSRDREAVRIEITDTGAGIDPADLDSIFRAYWSRKKGGTGLGLAFTRRIVEELGGEIRVCSELGRGTQMTLVFPSKPGEPGTVPDRPEGSP